MGLPGAWRSISPYQNLINPGSCKVLEGRRPCSPYSCGLSMVLLLVTGTCIFLCVTDRSLLSEQWGQVSWEWSGPNPTAPTAPSQNTEPHTEPHVDVHTEVHAKFQWEAPGPYHVAYPRSYIFTLDEPDACREEDPFLVLIVPVAAKNLLARGAIRRTWGNESLVLGKTIRLFFLLGLPSGKGSERLQADVEKEREEHRDLLQSNFLDSYRNLTIKTMMMLEWVASRCRNASYAMKVDSDVFLNVQNLVKMLLDPKTPRQDYITGMVTRHSVVVRNPNSKWYMPVDVYPDATYPPYPLGMGYVFSTDLPQKLVDVSRRIRPLYIEDVHVAMCLKQLGIVPTDPPSRSLFKAYMPSRFNRCHYAAVITTILDGPARLLQYWSDLQKPAPPC
ncbi:beta-1,3-galactosyltransferase 1-like [Anguilla anguilla]|uniref:beta-1,3-galactosyltransferase 1-like n=1 Tax=Anguilla anguilla TaxID=7936 RepID=UPI0015A7F896|nr:beta-1,3-galactosyltransferase 1-like [Anguilla anguilla]XP_035283120.1 beta-1,3-galactosyltransferase 1-like [Anguilla anguilla]